MCHGTTLFRSPHRERNAFVSRQTAVNNGYYAHAAHLDDAMGDTRCVDLLRQHGKVRVLVAEIRGANSDDFTKFIKTCVKSAAEENWDAMGAKNVHFAEQTYLRMFRGIVGLTIAREGAMWMRKVLAYFIDLKRGVPRGANSYT